VKKLLITLIILSSCSTQYSRSDAYYEAVAGHIAQTVLSGDCNSKCISNIVSSDLKYATYTQAIIVINKVNKLSLEGGKTKVIIDVEMNKKIMSFQLNENRKIDHKMLNLMRNEENIDVL